MRTLGVDLSSQPKKTAMCEIEWRTDSAKVVGLTVNISDDDILKRACDFKREAAKNGEHWAIGIDAPFGWPVPFVDFMNHIKIPSAGAANLPPWNPDRRNELYLRLTDHKVIAQDGPRPLSVAADRIALPAMRCAGLLEALHVVDRSGVKGVFEVYPAAALKAWGLPWKGYKTDKAKMVAAFKSVRITCKWLKFAPEADPLLCETNDDAFDALIAALVTRAAALERTIRPCKGEEARRAETEGWIAIPKDGCKLGDLVA